MDYERPKYSEIDSHYIEEKERLALTVKTIRKKRGLSQKEFAFLCRIDPRIISDIEKGIAEPMMYTLVKIASFTNLTVCELLWAGYVKF